MCAPANASAVRFSLNVRLMSSTSLLKNGAITTDRAKRAGRRKFCKTHSPMYTPVNMARVSLFASGLWPVLDMTVPVPAHRRREKLSSSTAALRRMYVYVFAHMRKAWASPTELSTFQVVIQPLLLSWPTDRKAHAQKASTFLHSFFFWEYLWRCERRGCRKSLRRRHTTAERTCLGLPRCCGRFFWSFATILSPGKN